MKSMTPRTILLTLALSLASILTGESQSTSTNVAGAKPAPSADAWKPLRPLIGKWEGEVSGEPGTGKVEREYVFVLNGRFIRASNKSTYAPQPQNPKGEVHEDVGYFSNDRAVKKLVLRQFHTEGFVNQYSIEKASDEDRSMTFVTTAIENIPAGWRARESYKFEGDDKFTETFELAEPDKEFKVYSTTRFRRMK